MTCRFVGDFGIAVNTRRAQVTAEQGGMVVELAGREVAEPTAREVAELTAEVERLLTGVARLTSAGVVVDPIVGAVLS